MRQEEVRSTEAGRKKERDRKNNCKAIDWTILEMANLVHNTGSC